MWSCRIGLKTFRHPEKVSILGNKGDVYPVPSEQAAMLWQSSTHAIPNTNHCKQAAADIQTERERRALYQAEPKRNQAYIDMQKAQA